MAEEVSFKINDGDKEWEGKLKINEVQDNLCIAKLESRGTAFDIVLNCYFDKYGIQEWCVTVPDWDFGFKANKLEEYLNEEKIEKYISNKVDRKSLTSGITEMFRIVEQYRMSRTEIKRNQDEKSNPVDDFIKENVTNAALDKLNAIRAGQNVQHAMWCEEQFKSYIDTFIKTENNGKQAQENSLEKIKTGLKDVFLNITINFPYDKTKLDKMCDNAEKEIFKITGHSRPDRKKDAEEINKGQEVKRVMAKSR